MYKLKNRTARTELYHRYSRASELPLLILALAMIPILFGPEVFRLDSDWVPVLDTADWFIYAVFAADFALKLYLAPQPLRHVRENWIDVVVLALPLLRPLRLVRSVRLLRLLLVARLLAFAAEGFRKLKGILVARGFHWVLLVTLVVVVGSAALVTLFERDGGGSIKTFGDALWWAVTTVTTVGYGDTFPVTPEGRGIAVFLMLMGIAFFGLLTANVAAFFVESSEQKDVASTDRKLDQIIKRLDALESDLLRQRPELEQSAEQVTNSEPSQPAVGSRESG